MSTPGRSPLSYHAFRALWLAAIVSYLGGFVQNVGEAWLMMDLSKSPLPVAMLTTAFVGASFVMMFPAGVLADRYDRRSVALVSQIVQGAAALAMAALSFTGHITPTALVFGVVLLGIGMALGAPAWAALTPELLPRELVAEGVALYSVAYNLARTTGPAVGGVVLARFGATTSFAVNAASFGVVLVVLLVHRRQGASSGSKNGSLAPPSEAPSPISLASAFGDPWRVVVHGEDVRSVVMAMFGFTLGAGMFYALTPAFAKATLHATPLAYGVMIGALGFGAVLGASVVKRLRQRMNPRMVVTATMFLFAAASTAASRADSVERAMVLLVPAGIGWLGSFSSLSALVQLWAPDRVRARVVALYQMAHLATWAVAAAAGGLIADRFGVRVAMTAGGLLCFAAAFATWKIGLPRSFSGLPDEAAGPA